jgi:hypothetical protein
MGAAVRGTARRIGWIGASSRAAAGLVLVYLAVLGGDFPWNLDWRDVALGLALFPGVMLAVGITAGRFAAGPLRYTGPVAIALNCGVIVLLLVNPYTGGGAALFYGVSLLVGAWRRQPDCEATILSNWLLRRDDQVGCPIFTPIDLAEERLRRRRGHASVRARAREG